MEFLMDDTGAIDVEDILDEQNEQIVKYRLNWRSDFI